MPSATDKDVQDAEKFLEDKEVKHRRSSKLMHWLASEGQRAGYDALTPAARKVFFVSWVAKSMEEGNSANRTWWKVNHKKEDVDKSKWMANRGMIQLFGEHKALANIKLLGDKADRHRPDRDTGLDDEWSRECKIYEGEEINTNTDDVGKTMESEKEITSEKEKAEFAEDLAAAGILETAPSSSGSAGAEKLKDAKIKAERIFEVASGKSKSKYLGPLKTDVGKLIPRFKSTFNSVEKIHLKSSSEDADPVPDPEIPAVAGKLGAIYSEFNAVAGWFSRMAPTPKRAKK
ncbi:unnamed protein product, partial [Prorocentrum cordatum]